jgi:hypothetical protein
MPLKRGIVLKLKKLCELKSSTKSLRRLAISYPKLEKYNRTSATHPFYLAAH